LQSNHLEIIEDDSFRDGEVEVVISDDGSKRVMTRHDKQYFPL